MRLHAGLAKGADNGRVVAGRFAYAHGVLWTLDHNYWCSARYRERAVPNHAARIFADVVVETFLTVVGEQYSLNARDLTVLSASGENQGGTVINVRAVPRDPYRTSRVN